MTGTFLTARWNNIVSIVLGLMAAIYIIVVLTSTVLGDAASFIGLVVIGGIGCLASETHSAVRFKRTKWRIKRHTHPITIIANLLGIAALLLIIFTSKGTTIWFITGYTTAFIVLAVIIFLLFGLNITRNALLK